MLPSKCFVIGLLKMHIVVVVFTYWCQMMQQLMLVIYRMPKHIYLTVRPQAAIWIHGWWLCLGAKTFICPRYKYWNECFLLWTVRMDHPSGQCQWLAGCSGGCNRQRKARVCVVLKLITLQENKNIAGFSTAGSIALKQSHSSRFILQLSLAAFSISGRCSAYTRLSILPSMMPFLTKHWNICEHPLMDAFYWIKPPYILFCLFCVWQQWGNGQKQIQLEGAFSYQEMTSRTVETGLQYPGEALWSLKS